MTWLGPLPPLVDCPPGVALREVPGVGPDECKCLPPTTFLDEFVEPGTSPTVGPPGGGGVKWAGDEATEDGLDDDVG